MIAPDQATTAATRCTASWYSSSITASRIQQSAEWQERMRKGQITATMISTVRRLHGRDDPLTDWL